MSLSEKDYSDSLLIEMRCLIHCIENNSIQDFANLRIEYFTQPSTVAIFKRIGSCITSYGDIPQLEMFQTDGTLPEVSRNMLKALPKEKMNAADYNYSINQLQNYSLKKAIQEYFHDSIRMVETDKRPFGELLLDIRTNLSKISATYGRDELYRVGYDQSVEDMVNDFKNSKGVPKIPTTFEAFDSKNGGIPRTGFCIAAGTTGGGKSILGATMCRNLAQRGYNVVMIPLEMSPIEMVGRLLASVSGVPINYLMTEGLLNPDQIAQIDQQWEHWKQVIRQVNGNYYILVPESTEDTISIMYRAKQLQPDIIIIDHGPLLEEVQGEKEWMKLGEIAMKLKLFSRQHQIVTFMFSQLSDEGQLKYAKRIKDAADIGWFWVVGEEERRTGVITITQKVRNGDPTPFQLQVNWSITEMIDVPPQQQLLTHQVQPTVQPIQQTVPVTANKPFAMSGG